MTQVVGNQYPFFACYVILQFIVLAVARSILGGYAGYVNFGTSAFFGVGVYNAASSAVNASSSSRIPAMFAGVPMTICPAPNHAVDLDLAELGAPSFKVEPPAFHLHIWFPGEGFGDVVTHQVPIGTFDGPHPFFGPDGKLL